MIERTCAECGHKVKIDKENSHRIIHYKSKFYHFECFDSLCDKKIQSKRTEAAWTIVKSQINNLVTETTKEQKNVIAKDEIYRWMVSKYNLSFVSQRLFMKLASIYDGTYGGLSYPISAEELYDEWQFYWQDLCDIRQYKDMFGEQAVNYDLSVLLGKNAEYRSIKAKEQIAREIQKQQVEESLDIGLISASKRQPNNKIADLYKEMNGGEDNG